MIMRILLVRLQPGASQEQILGTLQLLIRLREQWPAIIDLSVGATTSPDYPYAAVLRFARPMMSIPVVQTPDYQEIIEKLQEQGATLLTLDLDQEDDTSMRPNEVQVPAYGFFQTTVEEQLRRLVYQWFQGTGEPLTHQTLLWNLPQEDDFGLDLAEFEAAIRKQFGVENVMRYLGREDATFGELLYVVEREIAKKQA